METKSKSKYIEAWNEHIKALSILGFCPDRDTGKRVYELRDELLKLVPKIADSKTFEED